MRVAVITPYYRETLKVLQECHNSVLQQTNPCTHFFVADGFPQIEVSKWAVEHITLSKPHADVGNTPRGIGSLCAMNQDFDAIAYLDADNWYYQNHIDVMVKLHKQSGAAVCTASRTIHRLDGSMMFVDRENDGSKHVDTSCLFLTRQAFRVLPAWTMMPKQLGPYGDRMIWSLIQSMGLACAHHAEPTVAFRTQYDVHYRLLGETPPPGTKTIEESTGKAWQWWHGLPKNVQADWLRQIGFPPQ